MDRVLKTARVSSELSGMSMSKVASAIEDYVFQLQSVAFLREQGETDAANTLEAKIIGDLGENIATVVDEGLNKKPRKRKKS